MSGKHIRFDRATRTQCGLAFDKLDVTDNLKKATCMTCLSFFVEMLERYDPRYLIGAQREQLSIASKRLAKLRAQ